MTDAAGETSAVNEMTINVSKKIHLRLSRFISIKRSCYIKCIH